MSEASNVWYDCFSVAYHYDSIKTIDPDVVFHIPGYTTEDIHSLAVISLSILVPPHIVHDHNEAGNIAGPDRLSWASVSASQTDRY